MLGIIARAMIHHANVPVKDSYGVFKEEIQYATLLHGSAVVEIDGKRATRLNQYAPN